MYEARDPYGHGHIVSREGKDMCCEEKGSERVSANERRCKSNT